MDKDEILKWKARYDNEEDLSNSSLEQELRIKFQKNQYATKEDLEKIIGWKFQGRLMGRRKRILNLINPVKDEYIQTVSRLTFQTEDDQTRLSLLTSINGVGVAISSVILTFYDPKRYGVIDIHDWRELFGKEPSDMFTKHKYTLQFFSKLREIADKTGLTCREVEKALFKKNLEKGSV